MAQRVLGEEGVGFSGLASAQWWSSREMHSMTGYGRRRVQGKAEVAVGRLGPQHRGRRQLPVYGRVIILSVRTELAKKKTPGIRKRPRRILPHNLGPLSANARVDRLPAFHWQTVRCM